MMVYSFLMKTLVMPHFVNNEMGIPSVNLNNIDLDNNFDEDDLDTIILIRLLDLHSKFKNAMHLKKDNLRINSNSVAS